MTTFNAEQFMNTTYKEALDTKLDPIPDSEDGSGWEAQITDLKARTFKGKDGSDLYVMDVTWLVLAEAVKKSLGIEKPMVRQSVWLEFTKEGNLDFGKGKNLKLGKLKEALGQNKAGKNWSPNNLMGQMAMVITEQTPDKDDPELIYSNVKKVLPI